MKGKAWRCSEKGDSNRIGHKDKYRKSIVSASMGYEKETSLNSHKAVEGCKNDLTPEMEIQLRHITTADSTADGRTVRVRCFETWDKFVRIHLDVSACSSLFSTSPTQTRLSSPNLCPAHTLNLCPTII